MMQRDQCFAALARHVTDEIVVASYSSAFEWLELGERSLNYFSVGAMGLDSSHALGLALGRPDRRIICLQGDGSLLMNLGALVTIAAAAPKNLVHFVVQNGTYEANGGHPIPNKDVDFAAMARGFGCDAVTVRTATDIKLVKQRVSELNGPLVVDLKIDPAVDISQ